MLYPRARVLTLVIFGFYVRTIEVPAMFVLGFWFILQFLNALLASGAGQGVAWYAHIGGFVAGLVLIGLFKRRNVPSAEGRETIFMIVPCECGAKLKIDEAKIGPLGVKVRCPRCGNILPVQKAARAGQSRRDGPSAYRRNCSGTSRACRA